ncbi:MAG: hypothetical protein EHM60_09910 [Lysobacterales bacterium]|nr:MAG: hypothetical protein EHM60_09910 [Xanthomonadales bacterium]
MKSELAQVVSICADVGGKALTDQAVERVDLNADGKDDYVLDVGRIQCEGAASAYGDRAKDVSVYLGDGAGGASKAWSGVAYGSRIEGSKLWLGVSGAECGKPPAQDFASESFCERPLAWNAAQRKLEFAPVSAVKMLQ